MNMILKYWDIRNCKPVLIHKIKPNSKPSLVLQALTIYKDDDTYVLKMVNYNGLEFWNRLELKHLIFVIHLQSSYKLCIIERAIQAFEFIRLPMDL